MTNTPANMTASHTPTQKDSQWKTHSEPEHNLVSISKPGNGYGSRRTIAINIPKEDAELIVKAVNCHDELVSQLALMTYLVRLKYGNLDPEVYSQIEISEALVVRAKTNA